MQNYKYSYQVIHFEYTIEISGSIKGKTNKQQLQEPNGTDKITDTMIKRLYSRHFGHSTDIDGILTKRAILEG